MVTTVKDQGSHVCGIQHFTSHKRASLCKSRDEARTVRGNERASGTIRFAKTCCSLILHNVDINGYQVGEMMFMCSAAPLPYLCALQTLCATTRGCFHEYTKILHLVFADPRNKQPRCLRGRPRICLIFQIPFNLKSTHGRWSCILVHFETDTVPDF